MSFLFGYGTLVDRVALWTGTIVIVTALAAGFGLLQLRSIRRTSRADFAKRFIDSFFNPDTRSLLTLLLNSALEFDVKKIVAEGREIDQLPYLRINNAVRDQLNGIVPFDVTKIGYSAFEIDDLLLGHFEDVGWYVRHKLIDINTAFQSFGYYVIATFEHPAIKQYVANQSRNEYVYEDFEWLYRKFKKLET